MGSPNIMALKELTDKLPPFPDPIGGKSNDGYREYKMDSGVCFAWFIHRSGNDIAIHRWFSSKGTVFPEHTHPEKEWLIIYKGSMDFVRGGETVHLATGDFVFNEPNVPHSSTFPEDCKYITVMIPPSQEYPNGIR